MRVCIVAEGCYPVIRGGLSEWPHMLIKHLPDLEFDIVSISPTGKEEQVYELFPNTRSLLMKSLIVTKPPKLTYRLPEKASRELAAALGYSLSGVPLDCEKVVDFVRKYPVDTAWLFSEAYWDSIVRHYKEAYADVPFLEYYWTIYGFYSILLSSITLLPEVPKADAYHCLSATNSGLLASLAKVYYRRPYILTEQGLYLNERRLELSRTSVIPERLKSQWLSFAESLVKTSYTYADRIVPPCFSHTRLEVSLGADERKIQVIDNGIECEWFQPGSESHEGPPVIGCFARVVPIKGITTLIKAAKKVLERHEAMFYVLGDIQDPAYYEECQALVQELGIKDNFKFMGHQKPLEWYHRVDIFTLTSNSEGVPYALLEAMSCGLPSVCTAVGGIPEILPDKSVGYVIPPGDSDRLAEKLSLLVENSELRRRIGRMAHIRANEKYNIRRTAANFRAMYEELVNGRSRNEPRYSEHKAKVPAGS